MRAYSTGQAAKRRGIGNEPGPQEEKQTTIHGAIREGHENHPLLGRWVPCDIATRSLQKNASSSTGRCFAKNIGVIQLKRTILSSTIGIDDYNAQI